jgi:hypothetical protein
VDFVGWADCDADSADLRILLSDEQPHVGGASAADLFGSSLRNVVHGLTLNPAFKAWGQNCSNGVYSFSTCVRQESIHEFGHVLGFKHEQDRPDVPACPNGADKTTDTRGTAGMMLSPYDVYSMMNYCNPDMWTNPHLSEKDIAGVRAWYGIRGGAAVTVDGCYYPCEAYQYAEGECRTNNGHDWSCHDGCIQQVTSCAQPTACKYGCAAYGYPEGKCDKNSGGSWLCERGCVSSVPRCAY